MPSNGFNCFRDEIMEVVIAPKFELLSRRGQHKNKKEFFNHFREIFKCDIADSALRGWLKELGYELVEGTEIVRKGDLPTPQVNSPLVPEGATDVGFDNETNTDWIGGIVQ